MFSKSLVLIIAVALSGFSFGLNAQIRVQELDENTLQVTDYRGKPPYKRQIIRQQTDAQRYERYARQLKSDSRATQTTERRGAPGKSFPRTP